jgi:hypothetical protein
MSHSVLRAGAAGRTRRRDTDEPETTGGSTVLTLHQIVQNVDSHSNPLTGTFSHGNATLTDEANTALCKINEKADIK